MSGEKHLGRGVRSTTGVLLGARRSTKRSTSVVEGGASIPSILSEFCSYMSEYIFFSIVFLHQIPYAQSILFEYSYHMDNYDFFL